MTKLQRRPWSAFSSVNLLVNWLVKVLSNIDVLAAFIIGQRSTENFSFLTLWHTAVRAISIWVLLRWCGRLWTHLTKIKHIRLLFVKIKIFLCCRKVSASKEILICFILHDRVNERDRDEDSAVAVCYNESLVFALLHLIFCCIDFRSYLRIFWHFSCLEVVFIVILGEVLFLCGELLENLLVVLVHFAEVDHLKVWNHLRMLIYQKLWESLVRDYRDQKHLKILQGDTCAVFVIKV